MAKLVFYMTGSYGKSFEKILAAANRERTKENLLPDISAWERSIIRAYLQNYVAAYRKWEVEGEFTDRRNMKTYELAEDGFDKDFPRDMKPKGRHTFKRILALNDKQLEWLTRMVRFNREADRVVTKKEKGLPPLFESQAKSVGEFVARMLVDSYTSSAALQDLKEMDEEPKR